MEYRGRFAPSPSGRLHQGSLIAGYASYLRALEQHGSFVLRIEDLDFPRCPISNTPVILEELELLGIQSDESTVIQSRNLPRYDEVINSLLRSGVAYYCQCTRAQIKERPCPCEGLNLKPDNCNLQSCDTRSVDPRIHNKSHAQACDCHHDECSDGTSQCSGSNCNSDKVKQLSIRINLDKLLPEFASFNDANLGQLLQSDYKDHLASSLVLKRADDIIAYNLACVVDDHDEGISEVVRGADMLDATFVQLCLYKVLGYEAPEFLHVPLIVDHNGNKLSKQNKAAPVLASMLPHEALLHTCRLLNQKISVKANDLAEELASFTHLFTNQLTTRYAEAEGEKLLAGNMELSPAAITNGIMSLSYQCFNKKIDSHRLYEQLHSGAEDDASSRVTCAAPGHCDGPRYNSPCAIGCHGRNELSAIAQPSALGRALAKHVTERELTKIFYAAQDYRSAMQELIYCISKTFSACSMPKQSIVI
ncbi:tRNA glutamyl-Q(34) synthetase GluQRS [Anaerobiospirillum succiniciproducens]|uniref:tRNA glutamyl-Q(34) synthetase GluQRS n=1 Tax=Anaerobiospirillum succiniciproducens TaxID=13335 RepID=UPI00248EAE3A|nr:tRNA glutamyl-Q(34) synthetase GluQRS [Anaerobiospirillum succiniciproducens]